MMPSETIDNLCNVTFQEILDMEVDLDVEVQVQLVLEFVRRDEKLTVSEACRRLDDLQQFRLDMSTAIGQGRVRQRFTSWQRDNWHKSNYRTISDRQSNYDLTLTMIMEEARLVYTATQTHRCSHAVRETRSNGRRQIETSSHCGREINAPT